MYHNGKLVGKSDVVMEFRATGWTIKSESSGTHGIAELLDASQVVDRDDLEVRPLGENPKDETSDATETVDADLPGHAHLLPG